MATINITVIIKLSLRVIIVDISIKKEILKHVVAKYEPHNTHKSRF